jgi:hypothetical protein
MNYYAKLYTDDYYPENIKLYISVIEGIYETNGNQKARVVGIINITENTFCKYVKQSYNVVGITDITITLKKSNYSNETRPILHEETYILLSHLLITEGYTPERVEQITNAVHTISNNKTIKTNQNCLEGWISF